MPSDRRGLRWKPIGEQLMDASVITAGQLELALVEHRNMGVQVGRVLVNSGYASERDLAQGLARQSELPFLDLRSAKPPEKRIVRLLPRAQAQALRLLPLWEDGEAIVLASPTPPRAAALDEATQLMGKRVLPAVVASDAFDAAFESAHQAEHLVQATSQLATRSPEDSASSVLTKGQAIFFVSVLGVLCAGLLIQPSVVGIGVATLSTLFYVALSIYKFKLVFMALTHRFEVQITEEELRDVRDSDLPTYTILVPLYREAAVLPTLVRAISQLDYPKVKLDVKLLLEEDDDETLEAAREGDLPSYFQLVVVPAGPPQGKPKACNYGLIQARGEYVVIYDAEDLPEPDQLKKAVLAFRKGGDRLACVQAKLNFFNPKQNLLTRWFAAEYSMWFGLVLRGLDASDAPIPLGGTSNHFATQRLRELGAWDPHNVTEDADLGIRLYKAGWKTAVIDSTTYEEANPDLYNWIRQRSRWVKGYIVTYLVHMRHPIRLWQQMGTRGFLSFQFTIGGTCFALLVNPLLWALTALWFMTRSEAIQAIFPAPIFYLGTLALFLGNFTFVYLNLAGCLEQGYYDLALHALLSPVYWALMSVAAWKGFLQLFYAPSYWEKTNHGLHRAVSIALPLRELLTMTDRADAVRLSVVIPAFNEEARLPATLVEVATHLQASGIPHEILVVDDGSSDRTYQVAREIADGNPRIGVLKCEHRGKGAAVRSGVLSARGTHVLFCDADLPMPVEDLTRLDSLLDVCPVAIASREGQGASRTGEPIHRRLMGRVFNFLTRAMALPELRDTQCGLKGFHASNAREIFSRQTIDGFGFDVEILVIARRMGYRMVEMPISWSHRPSSRVDPIVDTLRMLMHLVTIQCNDWRGRYVPRHARANEPGEIFAPPAPEAAVPQL